MLDTKFKQSMILCPVPVDGALERTRKLMRGYNHYRANLKDPDDAMLSCVIHGDGLRHGWLVREDLYRGANIAALYGDHNHLLVVNHQGAHIGFKSSGSDIDDAPLAYLTSLKWSRMQPLDGIWVYVQSMDLYMTYSS